MKNKTIRLYNIILPIWLLIWWPSWLWLILIPVNFLIDLLVSTLSMKHLGIVNYRLKALKHSWKICLIGFFADFIGSAILFGIYMLAEEVIGGIVSDSIGSGLVWKPTFGSVLVILLSIAVAGAIIYVLNRWMLKKDPELTAAQIHRIALNMAIFTAPYLFLIPSSLIYH